MSLIQIGDNQFICDGALYFSHEATKGYGDYFELTTYTLACVLRFFF